MENYIEYVELCYCDTCKYAHKCARLNYIYQKLQELEVEVLDKWKLNLEVDYLINDCDLYMPNLEKVTIIGEDDNYER
ncbi:hypothetical protein E308F_29880 [Moorella sp. E308F]|uniref:hypothetical protein n=1 Tax=Moorella sp. E308F TaxID=2572682 RepID=UPI0010FFBD80|nr:hypothetical protein [Moorella sp. E308F]GEA16742.1 hypothetical protein E308F_29880 [Moorella sp. E308F]